MRVPWHVLARAVAVVQSRPTSLLRVVNARDFCPGAAFKLASNRALERIPAQATSAAGAAATAAEAAAEAAEAALWLRARPWLRPSLP